MVLAWLLRRPSTAMCPTGIRDQRDTDPSRENTLLLAIQLFLTEEPEERRLGLSPYPNSWLMDLSLDETLVMTSMDRLHQATLS